jgi:hypothetical protein
MADIPQIHCTSESCNLNASKLDSYIGQSVETFCGKYGKKGDSLNHCAHFVSHALSLRIVGSKLCSNVAGSTYNYQERSQGYCIAVDQIFNNCINRCIFDIKTIPNGPCFIVATTNDNLSSDAPPKLIVRTAARHIGIFCGNNVYHYSNSRDMVVKVSLQEFRNHYGAKKTILLKCDLP